MTRLISTPLRTLVRTPTKPLTTLSRRQFASTNADQKGSQNSTPGWQGRHTDDHAVKRDRHDVQGNASQEGLKKHQEGKDHETNTASGQAISRKDEGNSNKKAKEEHPEAPEPVIGMNSERGAKGH